jgi:tRNA (guanine-N7-)-methyltransferase
MERSSPPRRNAPPAIDLKPYFQTLEDLSEPIRWADFFGNDHPVELEVGTGRGLFLVNAGQQRPGTNFLGIELDFKEGRYAAKRLLKRALPNVRILGGDAKIALPKLIAQHSLTAVHVYFPDPWWKRRHRERRIFNEPFVAEVARILQPGGILHAWTDVAEYFGVMQEVVAGNPHFQILPPPEERPATHDLDYQTNFERKKRQAGLPIYRSRWERKPV